MRILKKKIAQAQAFKVSERNHSQKYDASPSQLPANSPRTTSLSQKRTRISGVSFTPEKVLATKNIVKNFGQAICRFILSDLAIPYLDSYLDQEGINIEQLRSYIKTTMVQLDSLFHFRSLLLIQNDDKEDVKAYKRVFRVAGEAFIKYFSVNWIFNSKVQHKKAHLMFRFKMLRRIQSPEFFTYLKSG